MLLSVSECVGVCVCAFCGDGSVILTKRKEIGNKVHNAPLRRRNAFAWLLSSSIASPAFGLDWIGECFVSQTVARGYILVRFHGFT